MNTWWTGLGNFDDTPDIEIVRLDDPAQQGGASRLAVLKADGSLLWDVDTAREFAAVNGMKAQGGGMSGAGAAIGDGYIAINSGYGLYFHEPGNVLLVFGPRDISQKK